MLNKVFSSIFLVLATGTAFAATEYPSYLSGGTVNEVPVHGNIPATVLLGLSLGGVGQQASQVSDVYYPSMDAAAFVLNANTVSYDNTSNSAAASYSFPYNVQDSWWYSLGESKYTGAGFISLGSISVNGVNSLNYYKNNPGQNNLLPGSSGKKDNFAWFNYNLHNYSSSNIQVPNVSLMLQSNQNGMMETQPSLASVQMIEPADQYDNNMPVYHIVIKSGAVKFNSSVPSLFASAYFLKILDSSGNLLQDGYILEPLYFMPPGNDGVYQLSQADFYYNGSATSLKVLQNMNYAPQDDDGWQHTSDSDYQGIATISLPTEPDYGNNTLLPANSSVTLNILPDQSTTNNDISNPIYANGMNQAPFTVTISVNGDAIPATGSPYSWLYQNLYFIDADTGAIVNNMQNEGGSEAITTHPGLYTTTIMSSEQAHPLKGSQTINNTFYYSSTQVTGDLTGHGIEAVLAVPFAANTNNNKTTVSIVYSNQINFPVENNSAFAANTWTGSTETNATATLSMNNNIQAASASQPAVYLNLENPADPTYVGFVHYTNASIANNYLCMSGTSTSFGHLKSQINGGSNISIHGSSISMDFVNTCGGSHGYTKDIPVDEIAIDLVDKNGNLFQSAGVGG